MSPKLTDILIDQSHIRQVIKVVRSIEEQDSFVSLKLTDILKDQSHTRQVIKLLEVLKNRTVL